MTSDEEPRRWVDDETDATLLRLVRAGRADGPSPRALRAAPVAVTALLLSAAPAATAATAAEAGRGASVLAAKGSLGPLALLKWVAIGTLSSSSLLALVRAPELLRPTPAAPMNPVASTSPRRVTASPVPPVSSQPPIVASEPEKALLVEVPAAPSADVAREVALLDAARAALVAGDAENALRLLRALDRLPARALLPEATVLTVRALLASGSRTEARRLATQFCESAPSAPQASTLRSLIANSEIQPRGSRL